MSETTSNAPAHVVTYFFGHQDHVALKGQNYSTSIPQQRAVCTCGWSVALYNEDDAKNAGSEHIASAPKDKV